MNEPKFDLNVTLSLFDGISCGQEALKKAGISTRIFLASEIEKHPKMITRKNHPLTVQLGDVRDVKGENLPKVDLIFAGSPCQDVSFAGKGKGLIKGERSNLFFEFVRILEECRKFNPDVKFLLENVKMRKEYETIISEHLGVEPVMINSALVSAQNRKRLYWTNIPGVGQPDDLQIDLVDVLEEDATEPMLSNIYGGFGEKKPRVHTGKSVTIRAASGGGHIPSVTIKQPEDKGILLKDVLEDEVDESCLHTTKAKTYMDRKVSGGRNHWDFKHHSDTDNDKSAAVVANFHKGVPYNVLIDREPKVLIIPEQVRVRKHEVDIESLQHCLLNALENSNKTKKQVAEELNDKFSTVEHYFRKVGSEFFCIPSENHWFELKEILNIETDEFDAPITEFEIRDGRYDMADRVYNPEYKAPTVIASGVAKVLIKEEWNPKQTKNYVQWDIHGKGHKSQDQRAYYEDGKHGALPAAGGQSKVKVMCGRVVGRKINPETGKRDDYNPDLKMEQRLEPRLDEKSGTLTTVTKDNVVVLNENQKRKIDKINTTTDKANCLTEAIGRGGSSSEFLTSVKKKTLALEAPTYRKLTCVECESLQTLPDNYTEGISNTQRYKALGNGWTIDVIVHILQGLKWQS